MASKQNKQEPSSPPQFDDLLRRMLATPPAPHKVKPKPAKPDQSSKNGG